MEERLKHIREYYRLSDRISTAGQPTEEQCADISAAGFETVINLAMLTSPGTVADEAKVVAGHGMRYIHLPVDWQAPQVEDAFRFFAIMQKLSDSTIFVHCVANKRVSVFMYLYRILCEGMAKEKAQTDLYHIWIPEERWQKFMDMVIEQYRT